MIKRHLRISIFFLLMGNFCLGISHILILPPWEGFDETAHYSYLQQIADTGEIPRQKKARISQNVEKYASFAPIIYSGHPPMENNGGFTYKSFFEASPEIINKGHDHVHTRPNAPRFYTEGMRLNWESQHPPFYYLVLAPIYALTRYLSWGEQITILRLISYLFTWSALIIGIYSYFTTIRPDNIYNTASYGAMLGICLWPLFFPSWFPAMARLGNDSLCALILAIVWFISIKASASQVSLRYFFALGILLSFGCLTKAFFIPITIGIISFWCFRQRKSDEMSFFQFIFSLCFVFIIIFSISGWWYIANWHQYGVVLGSDEMISLQNQGGLLKGLNDYFSLKRWIRGHIAFITTLSWCSSWSFARPPYLYLAPMALLVIVVSVSYLISLRQFDIKSHFGLPLWCISPVLIGFSFHVLVRIALIGEGKGTNGYYLNLMVVPLGAALGIGLYKMWFYKIFRIAVSILFSYALMISVATTWAQILLFSGIIFEAGTSKFYQMPKFFPPLLGLPDALARLKVIAYPHIGILIWVIGSVFTLIGLIFGWKWINNTIKSQT